MRIKRPVGFLHSGTIRLTELRARIGEYIRACEVVDQTFVITRKGKPVAKLVPIDEKTVIYPDGTFTGETPLTAVPSDTKEASDGE